MRARVVFASGQCLLRILEALDNLGNGIRTRGTRFSILMSVGKVQWFFRVNCRTSVTGVSPRAQGTFLPALVLSLRCGVGGRISG